MTVRVWLCVNEQRKLDNRVFLKDYPNCKTLGDGFKQARIEFPQYSDFSFIGKKFNLS